MLWGALRACYGTESEAVAAAARNTGTILPYLNSPSNIKGCYAVLVELLGREQAAEVCAKNPGILQCNPRVLAPERGTQSPARPRLERRRPRPWPSGDAGPWRQAAPSVPLGACRALCARGGPPRQWEEAAAAPGLPPRPHARGGAVDPPPSFPGAGGARRAGARRRDGSPAPVETTWPVCEPPGVGGPPGGAWRIDR